MISQVPSSATIVSGTFLPPIKFRNKNFPNFPTLLEKYGPHFAEGRFGPTAYTTQAMETLELDGVFGFKKNTFRKKAPLVTVIFFQIIRIKNRDFVCYTLANCNREGKNSPIQTTLPLNRTIYLMTLSNFKDRSLTRIFPTISIVGELFTMDLDLITYGSEAAEKARRIGQLLYDLLKTIYGFKDHDVNNVLEALCTYSKNPACLDLGFHGVGPLRQGTIDWERAWWSNHPSIPHDSDFHGD